MSDHATDARPCGVWLHGDDPEAGKGEFCNQPEGHTGGHRYIAPATSTRAARDVEAFSIIREAIKDSKNAARRRGANVTYYEQAKAVLLALRQGVPVRPVRRDVAGRPHSPPQPRRGDEVEAWRKGAKVTRDAPQHLRDLIQEALEEAWERGGYPTYGNRPEGDYSEADVILAALRKGGYRIVAALDAAAFEVLESSLGEAWDAWIDELRP